MYWDLSFIEATNIFICSLIIVYSWNSLYHADINRSKTLKRLGISSETRQIINQGINLFTTEYSLNIWHKQFYETFIDQSTRLGCFSKHVAYDVAKGVEMCAWDE
jgi:hypothetical protein